MSLDGVLIQFVRRVLSLGLVLILGMVTILSDPGSSHAGVLTDRVQAFPNWQTPPPVQPAVGDLVYPDWFAGTWQAKTKLVDLAAPLAPKLTTPGFEGNRDYLNRPIAFSVRFAPIADLFPGLASVFPASGRGFLIEQPQTGIVADRAFNGLNLTQAYLGKDAVLAVTVDPKNPNRQITRLQNDRQLEFTVLGRRTEQPNPSEFVATEITQQIFRGQTRPYLNRVEATTWYHLQPQNPPTIQADQFTAIYLSPQDPDFFQAGNRPIALYRYQLDLVQRSPQPRAKKADY